MGNPIKRIKDILMKRYSKKKKFKKDVSDEASKIFMKNYQRKYGHTGWPKASSERMIGSDYSKDYFAVEKQVRKVRKEQAKNK